MKKKILFVAQNMVVGGIQTSLLNLLIHLDKEHRDEYDIDLFTFGKGDFLAFVPDSINVIYGKKLLNLASTPLALVLKSKKITFCPGHQTIHGENVPLRLRTIALQYNL